ncbi:ABC transporter ATP-binding protein [Desulfovibrio sp. OttesenSCG-928-A18]|nr:ABC transporter ATP-binding protein [Desulfovibrio sp. OttesenSCG-928-A18]
MRFGGVTAVSELDMSLPQGTIAGLIGPNGAGKTTVFNIITGFYTPTLGEVRFKDKNISGVAPHRICKQGIARTFQNIRLFSGMSALENVMVGGHLRQKSSWWMVPFQLPSVHREQRELREKSMLLLQALGLEKVAHQPAGSLPYGAQRRLEIARALATNPSLMLLDEPAAGMNPQESSELMRLIRRVRDDFDLTILLIEHDMKVVMGVCSHLWVLEYGICIASGDPASIRSNERVIKAYLGQEYRHNA